MILVALICILQAQQCHAVGAPCRMGKPLRACRAALTCWDRYAAHGCGVQR